MSGKSTLLRAIGLNAVLAQAGAPVCAASFRMPPRELRTSIRIQDSLELGLSYFMAALARLKEIVDAAERHARRTASAVPARRGAAGHQQRRARDGRARDRPPPARRRRDRRDDDARPGAGGRRAVRVAPRGSQHFAEQVHADGRMTFDYRLRPGLATSTNALRLMQLIGIRPNDPTVGSRLRPGMLAPSGCFAIADGRHDLAAGARPARSRRAAPRRLLQHVAARLVRARAGDAAGAPVRRQHLLPGAADARRSRTRWSVEGVVAAPLVWLRAPPVLVHNLLLLGAIALSGAAMFLLVALPDGQPRRGRRSPGSCSRSRPYRFEHYMHMELQWTMWMPLAFLALHRTLDTGGMDAASCSALLVALQMLSSIYYGIFLATLAGLCGVLLLLARSAERRVEASAAGARRRRRAGDRRSAPSYAVPYMETRDSHRRRATDRSRS